MADIVVTVTIPEALMPRVQAATGISTKAEATTLLKQLLKQHVVDSEVSVAEATQKQLAQAEQNAVETKIQEARIKAETEITL